MNAVCVIDSSLPPYAAPLAHECVATVLVPQESATRAAVEGGFIAGAMLLAVMMLAKAAVWFYRAWVAP